MKIRPFLLCFLMLGLAAAVLAENTEILPLENLALPKTLGRVESKYNGKDTTRWIIHIQDIHAHLAAQENIAALLNHLNEVYGIKTAAVEGAWSSTSLPKSWGIPPGSRGKQVLAQTLLEQDYITGPVYAALFSKTPLTLVGIEDRELYEENRKVYLEYLAGKESVMPRIGILLHKIESAKSNFYNPDLFEFDKRVLAFRDGKKTETFIPYLLKLAGEKRVSIESLSQVKEFAEILELQKTIEAKKLEEEGKRLVAAFKASQLSFEELLKSGKVSDEKLEFYPQAKIYHQVNLAQEKIPHRQLFEEIDTLIDRLKEKLTGTSDEKAISRLSDAFYTAKKIMTLQASPQDLKVFETQKEVLAQDLIDLRLQEPLDLGMRFYEIAKKRDQIFFDKIVNDPKLQGNIAVITGGFHSDGMSEKFETAGVSYQVLIPDLGENPEPSDETLYLQRLKETVGSQTLSEQQNRSFTPGFDAGFARAAAAYDKGERNLPGLISIAVSYQIGAPAGASAAPVSAPSGTLPDEALKNVLNPENASKKAVFLIRQSVLKSLVSDKDSLAYRLWHEVVLASPFNTVIIFNDRKKAADGETDYFTDTEGKAKIKTVEGNFDRVLAHQLSQYKRLGVIDSDYASQNPQVVALPAEPQALALMRVLLENERVFSSEQIGEMMDRMLTILQTLFNTKAAQASA